MQQVSIEMTASLTEFGMGFTFSHDRVNTHLVHQAQNGFMVYLDSFVYAQPQTDSSIPVGAS